jgi:hypothetical protein
VDTLTLLHDWPVLLFFFLLYLVPLAVFLCAGAFLIERVLRKRSRAGECGQRIGGGERCRREWWHQGGHHG